MYHHDDGIVDAAHEHGEEGELAALEAEAKYEREQAAFTLATHNGFVTMTSPKTGDHRTFRVRTATFGYGDNAEKKRVVGLLTGSDNENDYINFGFVTDDGHVKVWRKFKGNGKRSAHEVYGVMLDDTRRAEFAERGFEYVVSSRCRRCNRTLTDPLSIELGIGPKCREAGM